MKRKNTKAEFEKKLNRSLVFLSLQESYELFGHVTDRERGMSCNRSTFEKLFVARRMGEVLHKYDIGVFNRLYRDWLVNGDSIIVAEIKR